MTELQFAFQEANMNEIWVYSDGGRSVAPEEIQSCDFYGGMPSSNRGDCGIRAISIALDLPYEEVWTDLREIRLKWAKSHRINPRKLKGVRETEYLPYLNSHLWTLHPQMVEEGTTVDDIIIRLKMAAHSETILVAVPYHLTAIKNAKIHDLWDCGDDEVDSLYVRQGSESIFTEILGSLLI